MEGFYPGSNRYKMKHKFLQYFKNTFLEHLCMMVSLILIEKDSVATVWDSFKYCILACKIRNQMHANFEKRKVPEAHGGNFAQNGSSVRHMFCTIFVPLSVAKVLQKHVRSSPFLVLFFSKENSHSHSKFTEWLFLLQLIYTKFFEQIFSQLLILVGDKKISKIYQRKLKSGDRSWAL